MHKVLRWVIRGLLGGIVILVVLLMGVLAYSGLSQRMTLASTRIDAERGIESLEKVVLGGLEQTICLRGHDQKADENALTQHGKWEYAMADFDLSASDVEKHFANYRERFGIHVEDR